MLIDQVGRGIAYVRVRSRESNCPCFVTIAIFIIPLEHVHCKGYQHRPIGNCRREKRLAQHRPRASLENCGKIGGRRISGGARSNVVATDWKKTALHILQHSRRVEQENTPVMPAAAATTPG